MDEEEKNLSKEEILEKYRQENKNGDERYQRQISVATIAGSIVLLIFTFAIWITEFAIKQEMVFSYVVFAPACGALGAIHLTQGILNRTKTNIVVGVVSCIMAIIFFAVFVIL